jgi:translation elongation factor EF-G
MVFADNDNVKIPSMVSSQDGLQCIRHHEAAVMQAVERPVPESLRAEAECKRAELVESVGTVDDEVMELFIGEKPVDGDTLASAIRRATIANDFFPVFMGSAYKNIGVQLLLDAVSSYLPDPTEVLHILSSPSFLTPDVFCMQTGEAACRRPHHGVLPCN